MSIAQDYETKLLTRPQAAAWLRERCHVGSKSWLAALSVKGQGPAFVIVGRQALYRPEDLAVWIEERFFSEKPSKHSAPKANHLVLAAEPLTGVTPLTGVSPLSGVTTQPEVSSYEEAPFDEHLADEVIPQADTMAIIERGLQLANRLTQAR